MWLLFVVEIILRCIYSLTVVDCSSKHRIHDCSYSPFSPHVTVLQRALASGCFLLLNATFDNGILDNSGHNRALGRQPWPSVTPEASVSGANGGAARVKKGRVVLWFTGSNDLGTRLQIQIRFRVLNTSPDDSERTLLSNAQCDTGARNIDITYRPSDQKYTVLIRTVQRTHTYSCNTNHPVSLELFY